MTLTGASSGTTLTDTAGNYSLSVPINGSYIVTPTKGPLAPGTGAITTTDVLAIQRHYLGLSLIPPGCRLMAADVVPNGVINTSDVIAVQRFFLAFSTGIGNAGQYKFTPSSSTYQIIGSNQVTIYTVYIVGDVINPFSNLPEGESPEAPREEAAPDLNMRKPATAGHGSVDSTPQD
jgi:hypothetical protein